MDPVTMSVFQTLSNMMHVQQQEINELKSQILKLKQSQQTFVSNVSDLLNMLIKKSQETSNNSAMSDDIKQNQRLLRKILSHLQQQQQHHQSESSSYDDDSL